MCGRYELNEAPARLGSRYRVEPGDLHFAQNGDVRPTETNPVIVLHDDKRVASMRKWGIVPFWAKDPKAMSTPFNARSEEAYAKPMFRGPFKSKRCLVPATAFFEWQVVPGQKNKQKIRIARADGDLVTLAGLYDYWHRGDEAIESYTILIVVAFVRPNSANCRRSPSSSSLPGGVRSPWFGVVGTRRLSTIKGG